MYDKAVVDKLVADFRRHDTLASYQIGKASIFLQDRFLRTNETGKTIVEAGVNWPAIGTVGPDETFEFAEDLRTAATIVCAVESALMAAGYLIWRNVK